MGVHRGAFEFDWRARFSLPLRVVGRSMSWGEALRLFERLVTDPSTHVGASLAGWSRPADRLELAVMDLYDLQHQVAWAQGGGKGSRPKPYPRPWPSQSHRRVKPDSTLTQDEIVAALRKAGHTAPLPGEPDVESEVISHG